MKERLKQIQSKEVLQRLFDPAMPDIPFRVQENVLLRV